MGAHNVAGWLSFPYPNSRSRPGDAFGGRVEAKAFHHDHFHAWFHALLLEELELFLRRMVGKGEDNVKQIVAATAAYMRCCDSDNTPHCFIRGKDEIQWVRVTVVVIDPSFKAPVCPVEQGVKTVRSLFLDHAQRLLIGKALLTGEYLALDPAYSGLVISVSSRFYTIIRDGGPSVGPNEICGGWSLAGMLDDAFGATETRATRVDTVDRLNNAAFNALRNAGTRNHTLETTTDTKLHTIHQNPITGIRPREKGAGGPVVRVNTNGVDGKLVIWNVQLNFLYPNVHNSGSNSCEG
ncbi:hypothetical protein M404DRAFT_6208 [Pisolithus tinctorius Marx 270]|uniref:Uncharacterized protein n=1 Tax=Pisolithus tinctorius Marx 270 TaxID=870435 RepID=A0A0C3PXF2_PISTI|nr:hypothetical protein M404DRAFT_6208 [Pisolithus tinctorius Marx 270]